jgi:hypothetical protein
MLWSARCRPCTSSATRKACLAASWAHAACSNSNCSFCCSRIAASCSGCRYAEWLGAHITPQSDEHPLQDNRCGPWCSAGRWGRRLLGDCFAEVMEAHMRVTCLLSGQYAD